MCHISIHTVQSGLVLVYTRMKGSLSLCRISFFPSPSVNSMLSNKEKTHHSTAFNTSVLSLPTSQCVCLLSLLCPGACILYLSRYGNRQLLKASMKYQHALCVDPMLYSIKHRALRSTSPDNAICFAFFPLLAWFVKII